MPNKPNAHRIDPTHVLITRMLDDSPRQWTALLRPERRSGLRLLGMFDYDQLAVRKSAAMAAYRDGR